MPKVTTMVALVALLTVLAASVAYAATIVGNANNNYLRETCKGDTMYGRAGDDVLDADNCGGETDVLYGGRGNDWLLVADHDARDILVGDKGFDTCVVGRHESDATLSCERVIVR